MSALVFLLVALVVSATGSFVLWVRARKPTSLQSSIDAFNREMRALGTESEPRVPRAAPVRRPAKDR